MKSRLHIYKPSRQHIIQRKILFPPWDSWAFPHPLAEWIWDSKLPRPPQSCLLGVGGRHLIGRSYGGAGHRWAPWRPSASTPWTHFSGCPPNALLGQQTEDGTVSVNFFFFFLKYSITVSVNVYRIWFCCGSVWNLTSQSYISIHFQGPVVNTKYRKCSHPHKLFIAFEINFKKPYNKKNKYQ